MSGQDELQRIIENVMIEHGPDGHCDGADKIVEAVRAYYGSRNIEAENARLQKELSDARFLAHNFQKRWGNLCDQLAQCEGWTIEAVEQASSKGLLEGKRRMFWRTARQPSNETATERRMKDTDEARATRPPD